MAETTTLTLQEYREMHPADLADRLQRLDTEEARDILSRLPQALAAAVLAELEDDQAVDLLAEFSVEQLVGLFQALPPNSVADLLAELPVEKRRDVLAGLPPEAATAVKSLLRYPEDTAGGIMTNRFIALREDLTVQESIDRLRGRREDRLEDVSYLYITDADRKLVGVVPLRDLVFRRPDRTIRDIMIRDVKCVRAEDDQEKIARQFEHYHYLGLPVLDARGCLVGVVKASDALQVAQAEATEDMQLMVGLSGEERALTPWHKSVSRRLPWLCLNLITAFMAAAVVGMFESTIARWTALAIFLPIVAGQGGNAGMQTLTIIIRDLALGELSPGDGWRALFKEAMLGLINGLVIGLVVGLVGYFWKGSWLLGVVAGSAMLLNHLAAALSGVMIPFGLKLFRVDPALASSIFVTTVTDVAGFFFFLGLAALALHWFGP